MNINSHIEFLNEKHGNLENKIHNAHLNHLPTASLKKQKLVIKDEILSLMQRGLC